MNMKSIACMVALLSIAIPGGAIAYTGQNLAPHAKISMAQATQIALKAHPGAVIDRELERESGGLRYSFDIKSSNVVYEVGIDAMTGKVLENSKEGPHPD